MSNQNNIVANLVVGPIDRTAAAPSISFGGTAENNSGTGIYGSFGDVQIAINGSEVVAVDTDGLHIEPGYSILGTEDAYSGSSSYQPIGPDLNLAAGAGKSSGTAYLAAVMGNLIGDALTKTKNYLGGIIGALSVTGARASTYPVGAVLAQISDGVSAADGAVVAYIDGDSAQTNANAAFKVMSNNSTAGSGFDYGLDLNGAAHDGYNALAILKADIRLNNASDCVIMTKAGVPTDGVTGATFAGKGSLLTDYTNGKLYINTNTKTSPTWTVVGSQT